MSDHPTASPPRGPGRKVEDTRAAGDGRPAGAGAPWRTGLAVVLLVLTAGCTTEFDNIIGDIFGRTMRDQPSVRPYEDPRTPPEGAVPFAAGNFPAEPGEISLGEPRHYGDDVPPPFTPGQVIGQDEAVVGLENPIEPTQESLARGDEVYQRYCAPCHGPQGAGDGPVVEAGYPAWSLLTDEAMEYADGYYYGIMRVGRGLMPAYGHQIPHYDRWHVVNYVRSLQGEGAQGGGSANGDDNGEEG